MKISFTRYPIDIILCMLWSFILLPLVLLPVNGVIRIIVGLPFIFFIPGYLLIFVFFPTIKIDERGLNVKERIILSFGFSIAIVSLIVFSLNYLPWGIRLEPILFSIFMFVIGFGFVACYRWFITKPNNRFTLSFKIILSKSKSTVDKIINLLLIVSIIAAIAAVAYVLITPPIGEQFTEFYIIDLNNNITNYPKDLTVAENANVTIGILNHEYKKMNYSMEVWLINQTTIYNESANENETVYNHMWFMDRITVMLNHALFNIENIENSWKPQWQYNYTFAIHKPGYFKLAFLLFTTPTGNYTYSEDYKELAEEKINSAYREIHLWITVS